MEKWAKVEGYEWLEVSNHGRVRTTDSVRVSTKLGKPNIQRRKGGPMSPFLGHNGYLMVAPKIGKSRKKLLVHRLVAKAFVPGFFAEAHVNHIDGNKQHNHDANLEWVTISENTRLQWGTGLVDLRGEGNPHSKLSNDDVHRIRSLVKGGTVHRSIADEFGISASLVSMIATRKRWASI